MPAQEGLRPHGECIPTGAGKEAAQGSEYQSVGWTPAGALGAASQDTHFMAEGEELDVTGRGAPAVEQGKVQKQTDDGITKGMAASAPSRADTLYPSRSRRPPPKEISAPHRHSHTTLVRRRRLSRLISTFSERGTTSDPLPVLSARLRRPELRGLGLPPKTFVAEESARRSLGYCNCLPSKEMPRVGGVTER
jgi:hypothetical protein